MTASVLRRSCRLWILGLLWPLIPVDFCVREAHCGDLNRPVFLAGQNWDSGYTEMVSSVNPEGADWEAETLEGKGFQVYKIGEMPLAGVSVEDRGIRMDVYAWQAIRLLSNPIPVGTGPITVRMKLYNEGGIPARVAVAFVGADENGNWDFRDLASGELLGDEIPVTEREISFTYESTSPVVFLILQAEGSTTGLSVVHVREIRVHRGWWPSDLAIAPTRLALYEDFEKNEVLLQRNDRVSTVFGAMFSMDTHTRVPNGLGRCRLMQTRKSTDVIQQYMSAPAGLSPVILPAQVEAHVWVRRLTNEDEGDFYLGLTDDDYTAVVSVRVADLPINTWRQVRTGGTFRTQGAMDPTILVQVAGGPASVLVDDMELHAPHDRNIYWEAGARPTATLSPASTPRNTPTPTPKPAASPTWQLTPIATPAVNGLTIISASATDDPDAISESVWVVEIDRLAVENPYPAPVAPARSQFDPVPGTAFISSTSRAGIERRPDTPDRILFRVPFTMPSHFSSSLMRIQTSFDGELRAELNGVFLWSCGRTPYEDMAANHSQLRPGPNELTFELNRKDAAVLAFSFRLVITWTP